MPTPHGSQSAAPYLRGRRSGTHAGQAMMGRPRHGLGRLSLKYQARALPIGAGVKVVIARLIKAQSILLIVVAYQCGPIPLMARCSPTDPARTG